MKSQPYVTPPNTLASREVEAKRDRESSKADRLYFRVRGRVGCGLATRVVKRYFARAAISGECEGSGCFISLPGRCRCHTAPRAITESTGNVTNCARHRGRDSIVTSLYPDRGFQPD